jgi:hypothetical protein
MSEPKRDGQGDTIGEGNYDASRRYREGLERSIRKGDADELAEEAKRALEGEEGRELRKAEEKGKRAENPRK